MARRRGLPAAKHLTSPSTPGKSRSRRSKSSKSYGRNYMNDKTGVMVNGSLGTKHAAESTPKGAFSPPPRQLMTPRATQSTSTDDHNEDYDSSFSETAEKLLSPRSKSIEDLRTAYRQTTDTYNTVTRILYPQLLSEDRIDAHRTILLLELNLARTKLALEYRTSHYEITRNDQPWSSLLPKLAVTKGWLEECVHRIEDPSSRPHCKDGNIFFELSHYFLAIIIKQHQGSLFEGRQLPSEDDIFEVFQRAEPRTRKSGLGPTLEKLIGVDNLDPELLPAVLLQLERRLASHTETNTIDWPAPEEMVSVDSERRLALRQQISELESYVEQNQNQFHDSLDVDTIEHELDSGSKAPTHITPHDNLEDPENNEESRQHWNADVLTTDDVNMDDNTDDSIDQDEWVASDFVLDLREVDPVILSAKDKARRDSPLRKDAEAEAAARSSQPSYVQTQDVLTGSSHSPLSEEQHDQPKQHLDPTNFSRRQRYELMAGRELSCDTSQMNSSPWSSSQPDLQTNGPEPVADQTLLSDLPDFDELMEDVPDEESPSQQQMASQRQIHPAALQHPIDDTIFVSDDEELPPDSNPWLAAVRARTSTTSSVSNTPIPSPPTKSQAPRRTGSRKSEPIVLIDSTARSSQRSRISDSMFVSDDEFDERPASSNPHLAAAMRRMAGRASQTNTPTSSASTSRTSTPKLPPHLAPVRRAAHRKSLDPSSQIPTAEEREILDQTEYPVVDIINEKTVSGEKKYLIKWKPIHGREFMDTWEPAENANALAVRDWERMKKRKAHMKKKFTKKVVEASSQHQREPSPELGEEDTTMFFVETNGNKSARFVPTPRVISSSPASLSTDQVLSHDRSNMINRDDQIASNAKPTSGPATERLLRPTIRYAAQPIQIVAVSPEPVPNPTSRPSAHIAVASEPILTHASEAAPGSAQKGVGNYWGKGKHPTQAQQRARMREKRAERRAAKAETLANVTDEQRAADARSKAMHKKSKKERRRTRAERYAALPQEEKDRVDGWIAWKRGLRARIKEDKKRAKANKARKMEAAAQKAAATS
ncbi:hypothetical protein KCU81_g7169, partial [Aureobasidium melanogenum]|uniref:Chromo domain-containing protein n=1 Tax=Aureobasidium melanogenum (strain CBS 110374) TaxID=1043003 RepID=A0A074VD84_AURM1